MQRHAQISALSASILLAMSCATAPYAFAHGGQYRTPGGSVPPDLRDPNDPTPPPPPPPPTGPGPVTPTDPPSPTGGPVTPKDPPTPTPPTSTPVDGPTPGGGRRSVTSFDQWIFWWTYNSDELLQLKASIYKLRASPGSGINVVGSSTAARSDATRATEQEVRTRILPALHRAMDPANAASPDTMSAAYIALGKITDDPSDIARIRAAVVDARGRRPSDVDQLVNESAAFALGLLRRTDAGRQFDAKELDRVRDALFDAFDSPDLQVRTRCFAMLSLGLLGDQPTLRGLPASVEGGAAPLVDASTAQRIFERAVAKHDNPEYVVATLFALSLQRPDTITSDMLAALEQATLRARLGGRNLSDLEASYAALVLGRIGTRAQIAPLLLALKTKTTDQGVKRSAAIALGRLGQRVDGADRVTLAVDLWRTLESVRDASTRNFGLLSLANLVTADVRADRTDVIDAKAVKVHERLLDLAADGRYSERPYGALALGIVARAIGDRPTHEAYARFRTKALDVLRAGLSDTKLDRRSQGAFAVALGMAKDEGAKKPLVDVLSDDGADPELRGYCAVALGMIEVPSPEVVKALKAALAERRSDELRLQSATGLGLLGQADAVPLLAAALKDASTQALQGQLVIALARIGDARAIPPLLALVDDRTVPDATRAIACAGLGLIGDLELVPSLTRLSKDINYRSTCDTIREVLSFL